MLQPRKYSSIKSCGIEVDLEKFKVVLKDNMETSIEGIFACGTVVNGYGQIK